MDKKIFIVALVGIVAGTLLITAAKENKSTQSTSTKQTQEPKTTNETPKTEEKPKDQESKPNPEPGLDDAYVIEYIGTAFVPGKVSVPVGATVRIENESNSEIDFASNPHNAHTDCPILNLGKIKPKQYKSFVVKEVKTCTGHNNLNPSQEVIFNFIAA